MGKIFCIMGKSSSGKDTIFRMLMRDKDLKLNNIVSYTTRPIREGEEEGAQYHFVDEKTFQALKAQGKVVEDRAYQTCHGMWRYFTVDDGNIDLNHEDYMLIGTIESFIKCRDYFGEDKMIPILIHLDDGERLDRALRRERAEEFPKYEEMCRRFLADSADFSEEKIAGAGIMRRFDNTFLDECLANIKEYILAN